MMCEMFYKHLLRQLIYKSSNTKRKSVYHLLYSTSKSSGYKATYAQLRFLANVVTMPDVTATEIRYYLKEKGFGFEEGHTCLHLSCPLCAIDEANNSAATMYINKVTGTFVCYTCKHAGSWHLFQRYLSLLGADDYKKRLKLPKDEKAIFLTEEEEKEVKNILCSSCSILDLSEEEILKLSKEFAIEGLSYDSLKNHNVKISTDHHRLFLPICHSDSDIAGIYMFSVANSSSLPHDYSILPRKNVAALFGLSRALSSKEVVLTSNPIDAMAVSQQTVIPGICIPPSTSLFNSEILPLMENFTKVTIWLGDDMQEELKAVTVANAVGETRCHVIHSGKNKITPLSCLQNNQNITYILKKAKPFIHPCIIKPHSIRDKVLSRICNKEKTMGKQWTRFPALNHLLKGLRPGELTIFTGPTGSGKTTFISEYSLDLCMQGVSTLWGSFEINNERLLKIMLTQFAQIPLEKQKDKCEFWADKFEQLPLYLMTFHGEAVLSDVLKVMNFAVDSYKTEHVVIDNVQFMLGTTDMNSSLDRFWQQDKLISEFRKFATQRNCHVTLVMHPRKERDTEDLNNYSIFGGAKATQEADNILILQDKRNATIRSKKYLQLTKNRFDGDLGIMSLEFDKETLSFAVKRKQRKTTKNQTPAESEENNSAELI